MKIIESNKIETANELPDLKDVYSISLQNIQLMIEPGCPGGIAGESHVLFEKENFDKSKFESTRELLKVAIADSIDYSGPALNIDDFVENIIINDKNVTRADTTLEVIEEIIQETGVDEVNILDTDKFPENYRFFDSNKQTYISISDFDNINEIVVLYYDETESEFNKFKFDKNDNLTNEEKVKNAMFHVMEKVLYNYDCIPSIPDGNNKIIRNCYINGNPLNEKELEAIYFEIKPQTMVTELEKYENHKITVNDTDYYMQQDENNKYYAGTIRFVDEKEETQINVTPSGTIEFESDTPTFLINNSGYPAPWIKLDEVSRRDIKSFKDLVNQVQKHAPELIKIYNQNKDKYQKAKL